MLTPDITLFTLRSAAAAGICLGAEVHVDATQVLHADPCCRGLVAPTTPLADAVRDYQAASLVSPFLTCCPRCGPAERARAVTVFSQVLEGVTQFLEAAERLLREEQSPATRVEALSKLSWLRLQLDDTATAGNTPQAVAAARELPPDLAATLTARLQPWQDRLAAALALARASSPIAGAWTGAGSRHWLRVPRFAERMARSWPESDRDQELLLFLTPLAVDNAEAGWAQVPHPLLPQAGTRWQPLGRVRPSEGADLARAAAALTGGGLSPRRALTAARAVLLPAGATPAATPGRG